METVVDAADVLEPTPEDFDDDDEVRDSSELTKNRLAGYLDTIDDDLLNDSEKIDLQIESGHQSE